MIMTDKLKKILMDYKMLKITTRQLHVKLGKNLLQVNIKEGEQVVVDNRDLIFVLQETKDGRISVLDLVNWVNVIWFSELYDYSDEHSDSIASVMTELEALDEHELVLPPEQIDLYIAALEKNEEYQ